MPEFKPYPGENPIDARRRIAKNRSTSRLGLPTDNNRGPGYNRQQPYGNQRMSNRMNRPGMNRMGGGPGMNRPGMNRQGAGPRMNRPGMNRMNRPGMNRPGMGGPGMNRQRMGRPGGMNRPATSNMGRRPGSGGPRNMRTPGMGNILTGRNNRNRGY